MTFYKWLTTTQHPDGPLRDLVRDAKADRGFPRRHGVKFTAMRSYLERCFACTEAIETLHEAWEEYRRSLGHTSPSRVYVVLTYDGDESSIEGVYSDEAKATELLGVLLSCGAMSRVEAQDLDDERPLDSQKEWLDILSQGRTEGTPLSATPLLSQDGDGYSEQ